MTNRFKKTKELKQHSILLLHRRQQHVEDPSKPGDEDHREDPSELFRAGGLFRREDDQDGKKPDQSNDQQDNKDGGGGDHGGGVMVGVDLQGFGYEARFNALCTLFRTFFPEGILLGQDRRIRLRRK